MWERVTFKVFSLCDKDSRFSRGDFTKLAYDVYNENMEKDKIIQRLIQIGEKYSFDEVLNNISNNDCYSNWTKQLRYFLYQFKEYLADSLGEKIGNELWQKYGNLLLVQQLNIYFLKPQALNGVARSIQMMIPDLIAHNVNGLGNLALLPSGENSRVKTSLSKRKRWHIKIVDYVWLPT